jgi:hypothetical protein
MEGKYSICCRIDWAERAHDVTLVDDGGQLLAKRHVTDDGAGYKILAPRRPSPGQLRLSRPELHQPPTARDQRSWTMTSFCSNSGSDLRLVKAPGIVSERPRTLTARRSHQDPPRV